MHLRLAMVFLATVLGIAPLPSSAEPADAAQPAGAGSPSAPGPGEVADPAPSAAPAVAAPPGPGPVRPILLVGFGGSMGGGGGGALSGDLGLRIAPWTARFAYRVLFSGGGYVTSASGRVGGIFAERSWAAVYVAAGAGRLTYRYEAPGPPSPGVTALTGEVGVHFFPRWSGGPIFALSAEVFAPLSRPSDPRAGTLSGPGGAVVLSANPVALLLSRLAPVGFDL